MEKTEASLTEKQVHLLKRNIKLVYALNASFMFMVLMPVIVPFFQSRGLDMENIFQLQAIFAACVLVCELPSGYISDVLGRKMCLIISCLFWIMGYSLFAASSTFLGLVVAEVLLGVAVSLFSGTDLAMLYDSFFALKEEKASGKVMGNKVFFQQSGEATAGLASGLLVLISIDFTAIVQAFVGLIPLACSLFLYEPPRARMDKKTHKENFGYVYRSLFKKTKLLRMILFNGMFYSLSTLVAVWAFQDYWKNIGIPLAYFGVLWAISNISVGIIGRFADDLEKKVGAVKLLVFMAWLPVIGYFGMGLTEAIWGAAFCLCFQVSRGFNTVLLRDALNRRVTSDMRATANSVMAMGTRTLFIFIGPAFGYAMDHYSPSTAYVTMGSLYIVCFFVLMIPFLLMHKSFEVS